MRFDTFALCALVVAEANQPLDLKDLGFLGVALGFMVAGRVVPGKTLLAERKDRKEAERRERELLRDEAKVLYVAVDKAHATSGAFDSAASSLIDLASEHRRAIDRLERVAEKWEREWDRRQ